MMGLRRIGLVTALLACLAGCGASGSPSASTIPKGDLIVTIAGLPGAEVGPLDIETGEYDLRWSCDRPISSDNLQITLFTVKKGQEGSQVARVINAPVDGDRRQGAYTTRLDKGVYKISVLASGQYRLSIWKRSA